jgi:hypothetical protein
MTKVKKFLLNVAIQICGTFAMFVGAAPIVYGLPFLLKQLPNSSISLPPILKIIFLIICITSLIFIMLRGHKSGRTVFNELTRPNFGNFMLYYLLVGFFMSLILGLIYIV